jgi:membrane-associated phospholipid phosphatase
MSSDIRAIWPGALLTVYLSSIGALFLVSRARPSGAAMTAHFGVLAFVALATWLPRTPARLRRWAPMLTLLFLYAVGHTNTRDLIVIGWEQSLFGGQPSVAWAARFPSQALSELLHLAYIAYYPIIFAVPALLEVRKRRDDFDAAVFVLLLTFLACFLAYAVFPVAGPRYVWPAAPAAHDGPVRTFTNWLLESRSSRGTAFPSSHVAVATAQCVIATRYFGQRGALLAIPVVLLGLGAVYGGYHYAIDVLAGALFGVLTALSGFATLRAVRRQANATAPT